MTEPSRSRCLSCDAPIVGLRYASPYADVADFHARFALPRAPRAQALFVAVAGGHLPLEYPRQRVEHLREEVVEIADAIANGDLVATVDGLIDLVYVAYGTAVMMGVTPAQWRAAWDAVHAANLRKVRIDDATAADKQGIRKPAGWVAPDLATIFDAAEAP